MVFIFQSCLFCILTRGIPCSLLLLFFSNCLSLLLLFSVLVPNCPLFFVFPTFLLSPNANNEMCNFYIMYYKDNDNSSLSTEDCWQNSPEWVEFPASASTVPSLNSTNPVDEKPHSNVHPEDDMNVHSNPENGGTPTSWSETSDTDKPTSSLLDDILNDLENGVGNGPSSAPNQSPDPSLAGTKLPDQVTSTPDKSCE